ncbi:MAG: hypothetical protein M1829_003041 [Trizodia sp. TS-e1964]|nr:MAG: hypothetical protein M1829_003041 [Trizodia sp. TS-e1964]
MHKLTDFHRSAVFLRAKTKFLYTGTPFCNGYPDIKSIVYILRLDSWDNSMLFKKRILQRQKKKLQHANYEMLDGTQLALMRNLMNVIKIRRTADSIFNGRSILRLPEKDDRRTILALDQGDRYGNLDGL